MSDKKSRLWRNAAQNARRLIKACTFCPSIKAGFRRLRHIYNKYSFHPNLYWYIPVIWVSNNVDLKWAPWSVYCRTTCTSESKSYAKIINGLQNSLRATSYNVQRLNWYDSLRDSVQFTTFCQSWPGSEPVIFLDRRRDALPLNHCSWWRLNYR